MALTLLYEVVVPAPVLPALPIFSSHIFAFLQVNSLLYLVYCEVNRSKYRLQLEIATRTMFSDIVAFQQLSRSDVVNVAGGVAQVCMDTSSAH